MNSRGKGARGELELAKFLESHGIPAIRGQQHKGGGDSPDVMHTLPGIHIECKRTERLELWEALTQAARDCGERVPTLWFRRNRWQWYVCLPASDFLELLKCAKR